MIPIVIPLSECGGKLRDNSELRFALRSIERHFTDPFEVVIVSKRLPEGFQGLRHLPCEKGLKSAIRVAAAAFPDGFFWFYDDCCLLQDNDASRMKVTQACRVWRRATTRWAKDLERVRKRLEKEGRMAKDYSRPHGPYWFTKDMVDEGFADWPGMAGKFPWESWILSKRKWPSCHGTWKQYYGAFRGAPPERARFLNYNDRGFTPELRAWLEERFPERSRFERSLAAEVPPPSRRVKLEVHTIRFGHAWWMHLCAPTLDDWCKRHGHPLRIWMEGEIDPAYPAAKFCEVDMLREFLAGENEWLLYVDADVYVEAAAPAHPEPAADFLIREDLPGGGPRDFNRWCMRNRKDAPGWNYRNAGVWMCSREGARRMLEVMLPPFIEGCQEQHQFNWWLHLAAAAGLGVGYLPPAWNAWAFESARGAFYHIAGRHKPKRLKTFQQKGFIPTHLNPTVGVMHPSVLQFFSKICTAERIQGRSVLEVGSFNVNGSVRSAVEMLGPEIYMGVDMQPQEIFVDEVVDAEKLLERFGKDSWDVVLTAEMLEHAENWQTVIENIRGVLKPGGLLVMTARSDGFPLHSYPSDHWRYSTDDVAAMFADFATVYLCDDTDPKRPGFFYAGIKPPHSLMAKPQRAPSVPFNSKEGFERRMAQRKVSNLIPDPVAAFYHVACMGPWKEVVAQQCDAFAEKGIRPRTFVLGDPEDLEWLASMPLDIIGSDSDFTRYETPTLAALWRWCRDNPAGAVLYCHTKGVSRPTDPNVHAWRDLMMEHVVGGFEKNLKALAIADGVGVNWKWFKPGLSHFSGNFWMARADWIGCLSDPWEHRRKGGPTIKGSPWDRMHAEMWFNSRPHYHVESLCCSEQNLWSGSLVHELLKGARQAATLPA